MNVVELTRRLVAFDTVNPPGNEAPAMDFCADLLRSAGFDCREIAQGPNRSNLLATKGLDSKLPALGFTGHLDTVPLGAAPWSQPPHGAEVTGDKLYGRGTTDMKGGVAAFIRAAIDTPVPPGGVALLITAGEETGSDGAREMVQAGDLPAIGALIVAEPTLNRVTQGHKGALWLRLLTRGITAHGSMPDKGVNAILKMAKAIQALEDFVPGESHEVMGKPTLNIGTISGGLNTNSVPDLCEVTLDMRSVPGVEHGPLRAALADRLGPDVEIETIIDLPSVWTDPADPWLMSLSQHAGRIAGAEAGPASAPYFTDASIFTPALGGIPTVILGPGDPALAHQTDEYISLDRLAQSEEIYCEALKDWNRTEQ
ncbi:M20 family metallopeptidase [Roseibium suaedae]|uniref:Probable succinyl-diaminopimelate desuccinylase n=1 Tax=Roseibium suaedae TaxID=735517 RepID=A0A1M7BXC0_9HYPH|nr:M20 family metallopeptidase [Roseibium suaedae]SHL59577.1 acetylornithine deacetylase [Roseibium suaedae]